MNDGQHVEEANNELQLFHSTIREYIIYLLFFLVLFLFSYTFLSRWRRGNTDREVEGFSDEEEATVHQISLCVCSFAVAVALGSAMLLPMSTIANEILLLYPSSYYMQWLNSSLIQGLWTLLFQFSNTCLLLLLPFAYLFSEAEGFSIRGGGLLARGQEATVGFLLLATIAMGTAYLVGDAAHSLLYIFTDVWTYYLPFMHSSVAFMGVILLLVCAPLGFSCLFHLASVVTKGDHAPTGIFLRKLDEKHNMVVLEEEAIRRRLDHTPNQSPMCNGVDGDMKSVMENRLDTIQKEKAAIEHLMSRWAIRRILSYPLLILLLTVLFVLTCFAVLTNMLQLLVGLKALPIGTEQFTLGLSSLSSMGLIGAFLEAIVIVFLFCVALVGLYSIPFGIGASLRPPSPSAPVLIINCALQLLLSQALPLLCRLLGVTNLDPVGPSGRVPWLGNFPLVLSCNIIFVAASSCSLATPLSKAIIRETWKRVQIVVKWARRLSGPQLVSSS